MVTTSNDDRTWGRMTDKEVIEVFLEDYKTDGVEIHLQSSVIRDFLCKYEMNITFNYFNRITGCLGRSTYNSYVYSVPILLGRLQDDTQKGIQRGFTANRIKTLSWYGSKRAWIKEWEILLLLVSREHGCTKLVDAFGGSGFISLLAARTGLYDEIILNDSSSVVYNYHLVQQSNKQFKHFIFSILSFGEVSKEAYRLLYKELYGEENYVGKEKRGQIRSANLKHAVNLFIIRHYAYDGQGSYVLRRKKPADYVDSLYRTHELYQHVTLSHLHYMKLFKTYREDAETLIVLDPPYLSEVRVQKQSYGKEFTRSQHKSLLQLLTREPVAAKVVVCGYSSTFYDGYFYRAEQEWHCLRLRRPSKRGLGGEGKECVWFNFDMAQDLMEYGEMFDLLY